MERNLPGVFSAAGLMVPDPSINPPPIPFIDDVAGIGGAEYMVGSSAWTAWMPPILSHRPCWYAKAPVAGLRWMATLDTAVMTECVLTRGPGASLSHAGRARKESLGPLFPGTILPLSQRVEADG